MPAKQTLPYLTFIFFAIAWCSFILLPAFVAEDQPRAADFIYHMFSQTCHQKPERSFFINDVQFAVCARCTGIYLGFLAGALLYPLGRKIDSTRTPRRNFLILSSLPMALDGGIQLITTYESNNVLRFITGCAFGAAALLYALPAYTFAVQGFFSDKADK